MKNVFFILVFILITTLTLANSNETFEKFSESNFETVVFGDLTTLDYTINFNKNEISYLELLAEKSCTLKGKFTITFADGSSYSWEGTLTIIGMSCAELLRELMAM